MAPPSSDDFQIGVSSTQISSPSTQIWASPVSSPIKVETLDTGGGQMEKKAAELDGDCGWVPDNQAAEPEAAELDGDCGKLPDNQAVEPEDMEDVLCLLVPAYARLPEVRHRR